MHGIDFYCGVPDSLLKDFCAYVTAIAKPEDHVITSNEGSAVALAAGYHMATHKPALVYLQVEKNGIPSVFSRKSRKLLS